MAEGLGAVLGWDRTIVPDGYRTRDSETVKKLAQELDFVHDFAPGREAQAVSATFVALLEQHQGPLQLRYGVDHMDEWPADPQTAARAPQRDPRLVYVSDAKLSGDLARRLRELRLGAIVHDYGEWIGMHPKLAGIYMAELAEAMARERHLSPVSDATTEHLAVGGWTMQQLAAVLLDDPALLPPWRTPTEVESALANVALTVVVPADLGDIPVEKIIEIRSKLQEERLAFQQNLREIVEGEEWLQNLAPDAVQWQLEILYRNKLKPQLDRYEQSLDLLGVPARRGIISLLRKTPKLVFEAAKGLGWSAHPAVGAVVTVASFVLPHVPRPTAQDPPSREPPPVAYLLHVKEGLTPKTVSDELARGAKRMLVGSLDEAGRGDKS